MWALICRSSLLLALLACPAAAAASQENGCRGRGECSHKGHKDTAQDSVLLQSKYSMQSETSSGNAITGGRLSTEADRLHDNGVEADFDEELEQEELQQAMEEQGLEPAEELDEELADDWMMEVTLDNQWIAGGGISDTEYNALSESEKGEFVVAMHDKDEDILKEGEDEALHEQEAWRQQFGTEHQTAVAFVRRRPELTRLSADSCQRYEGAGAISGLYTFGSPGTALSPLSNVRQEDSKFPGLRCVTQRVEHVMRIKRTFHDPVPFVAGLIGMKHPHMDMLVLPVNVNSTAEFKTASREVSSIPRSDFGFWIAGHFQDIYLSQLDPIKGAYGGKPWEMLLLTQAVSPYINGNSIEGNAQEAAKAGWNLVATSMNEKLSEGDIIYQDNTSLYQHPETQACALALVGTHHITQWLVNLRFRPSIFCGIRNVHIGFRNQVRRVIRSSGWSKDVLPTLSACSELHITGHSLGGAIAQLIAACFQRAPPEGEDGWEDYQHLIWTPDAKMVRTLPKLA